jgi:hypothetical protein
MSNLEPSPFQAGDMVRYTPSDRGHALDVMSERLVRDQVYRIERIENGSYIVVEGYRHPGGGLYWTEFSRADETQSAS